MNIQDFGKHNKIKSLTIHHTESDATDITKLDNEIAIVKAFSDIDMDNFKVYVDFEGNYSLELYLIELPDCVKKHVKEAMKKYDKYDLGISDNESYVWHLISIIIFGILAFMMAPKLYNSYGIMICIPITIAYSSACSVVLTYLFMLIWHIITRRNSI